MILRNRVTAAIVVAAAFLLSAGAGLGVAAGPPRVPFPEGYRNWFHVKSATVNEGNRAFAKFGGIHHIYANAEAVRGFKAGVFADGSVIVFDVLEFRTNEDKTGTEGARRLVDVMAKDATRFKGTGGWGFEEFQGEVRAEGSLTDAAAGACASCHATRRDHDSVFSSLRP